MAITIDQRRKLVDLVSVGYIDPESIILEIIRFGEKYNGFHDITTVEFLYVINCDEELCSWVLYKPKYKGRYIGELITIYKLTGEAYDLCSQLTNSSPGNIDNNNSDVITTVKRIIPISHYTKRIKISTPPEEIIRLEFIDFVEALFKMVGVVRPEICYYCQALIELKITPSQIHHNFSCNLYELIVSLSSTKNII